MHVRCGTGRAESRSQHVFMHPSEAKCVRFLLDKTFKAEPHRIFRGASSMFSRYQNMCVSTRVLKKFRTEKLPCLVQERVRDFAEKILDIKFETI